MKKAAFILAAALAAASLPALDLGFSLDSLSGLAESGQALSWSEGLRLGSTLSLHLGDAFSLQGAGYGSFEPSGEIAPTLGSARLPLWGSLDLLEADLSLLPAGAPARLVLRAGRIPALDLAAAFAPRRVDGVALGLGAGQLDVSLLAGYTGFQCGRDAQIVMTSDDSLEYDASSYFAPQRLYGAASARVVEALGRMDLSFTVGGQKDLRRGGKQTADSAYIQALLQGPLGRGLALRLAANGEAYAYPLEENTAFYALEGEAGLSWTPSSLATLSLSFNWASGGGTGDLSAWLPIQSELAGSAFREAFSGMYRLKISSDLSPLPGLTASLSAVGFGRTGTAELSDPDFIAGSASPWLGEEADASVEWRPLSDLRLSLLGSCFLPAWKLSFRDGAYPRWSAGFSAGLDF